MRWGRLNDGRGSSYSSVGQSVRLITVRSAVQARVGAHCSEVVRQQFLKYLRKPRHNSVIMLKWQYGRVVQGASFRRWSARAWVRTPLLSIRRYFPVRQLIGNASTPITQASQGACGVVVSRLLCMQKASGSNPDKSNFFCRNLELTWYFQIEDYWCRSCGVTVSTLDSESSDGGSNPPRTSWILAPTFQACFRKNREEVNCASLV